MSEAKQNPLYEVFTSREAAEKWELAENTVTQWCNRGKFHEDEARKSGKVWLVTKKGMERLTGIGGRESNAKNRYVGR